MISRQSIFRHAGRAPPGARSSPEVRIPEFLDLHGRTSKALRALTEAEMRRHGLHFGQDLVLAVLWERDGRTPGEVAVALHVTTPTIVKMATRMGAAGLLDRRRDDRDHRLVRLWLTEAGLALREPVRAARQSLEDRVTADLTEAERQRLLNMLATIHQTASGMLGRPADHGEDAVAKPTRARRPPSSARR